jgi:hypothetical protein
MNVTVYANSVVLSTPGSAPPPSPTRGEVCGFSAKSRKRLLDRMNRVRNIDGAVFVTLTYPDRFPRHPIIWKRHLAAFRKRLLRVWPKVGAVWRMELKRRKSGEWSHGKVAPHFHLVIYHYTGSIAYLMRWVAVAWYKIVESGDPRHLKAGTSTQRCVDRRHATWYVAKYVAKIDEDDYIDPTTGRRLWTGRVWGFFGQTDERPYVAVEVSPQRGKLIKSFLANLIQNDAPDFAVRVREAEYGITVYNVGAETSAWPLLSSLLQFCAGG